MVHVENLHGDFCTLFYSSVGLYPGFLTIWAAGMV